MNVSKFGAVPRQSAVAVDAGTCSVDWHGKYDVFEVEQFDGTWLQEGCRRCAWEALHNTPVGEPTHDAAIAQERARRLNLALFATGITPRFRDCTLDSFVADCDQKAKALSICRRYADQFADHLRAGRCLMLLGEMGNGKTHLACGILQHVVREHEATGLIVSVEDIVQAVLETFRINSGPSKAKVIEELMAPDLLVIDEVGMHTPKPGRDFTPGLLHEVIERRYNQVLPTILVSNVKRDELVEFIGPRAADRLRDNGGLLAPFTWESARSGGLNARQ